MILFDLDRLNKEIAELDEKQNVDGFWDDQKSALVVVNKLADLKKRVDSLTQIEKDYSDLSEVLVMAAEDEEMAMMLPGLLDDLETKVTALRNLLLFSGEYDNLNCIVEIHPGAGGTEAQDWADMLYRMYVRFCERNELKLKVLDYEAGDEAGLKSVTLSISGTHAYGLLKGEKGVHRLVRISPFDASARRHTSFASINVVPEFADVSEVVIDPKDLRVDTFRSGGAGGQNVNKVSSAVRITHLPTNIVVQCEIERSQLMNKATCMEMLKNKLMQKKLEEREAQMKGIVGEQKAIEWGSQIRSYVFCPYTLVKDHRTSEETSQVNDVMDGNISRFLYAYLEMESRNHGKKA